MGRDRGSARVVQAEAAASLGEFSHPSLKCQRLLLIQHFFANIKLPVSFFFSLFPCAESLLLCLVRCCQPSLRDRRNARTSRPTACLQDRRWRAVVGGVFHVSGYLSVDAQSACAFDPRSQLRLHRPLLHPHEACPNSPASHFACLLV